MRHSGIGAVIGYMAELFFKVHIPRAAAGLSYFLMLSIFPLLICVYTMLGTLLPEESLRDMLSGFLPVGGVESLVDEYLLYVSRNNSHAMLMTAIIAMATSSAAAFRTIHNIMGEMRGRRRFSGFFAIVFSFAFSLVFLAAIYFGAVVILTGGWFIRFVDSYLPFWDISASWNWIRFLLLFLLLFVIIIGVYRITAPADERVRLLPGAFVASLALVAVSVLFSYFIGMSTRYPVVYGSLASVMIMMLWLYICGIVLLGGNTLNVALEKAHRQ